MIGKALQFFKTLFPPSSVPSSELPLKFQPQALDGFKPLYVELTRKNEVYPVIIEKSDIPRACSVLSGGLLAEMEKFASTTPPEQSAPWMILVRNLDGIPEGMALSWLMYQGEGAIMKCERDIKRVLSGSETVQNVGLALLVAKLRWMKAQNYWNPRQEILTNYEPDVMASYRRKCGLDSFAIPMSTASVTASTGEMILRDSPLKVLELRP